MRVKVWRKGRTIFAENDMRPIGQRCICFYLWLSDYYLGDYYCKRRLDPRLNQASESMHSDNSVRIMAHGDLLYHLPILRGAEQPDGSYDFSENFTYVKPG